MDPQLASLFTSLAEAAAKNAASTITSKVTALKKQKNDAETISYLDDKLTELLDERQQLIGIAQALKQELTTRSISETDIEYITGTLTPIVKDLIKKSGTPEEQENAEQYLDVLEKILSKEVVQVAQILGFDFKQAIGEPLTKMINAQIMKNAPSEDLRRLHLENANLTAQLALDKDATDRFMRLIGKE